MELPRLLSSCETCTGMGFFPNPSMPDAVLQQRSSWCESTWYTAWDAAGEPYGGAVLTCAHCGGTGKAVTAAGQQILELERFVQTLRALSKDGM